MRKFCFLFGLVFFLFQSIDIVSSKEAENETGTLIVTYRTDNKGERLNRIRFWLKNEDGLKKSLYPKGKAFVDDPEDPSRMTAIENLPIGHYTLEFLIPNTDNYFQAISPRKVIITPGDVVKIDQQIRPAGTHRGEESKPVRSQKLTRVYESSYFPTDHISNIAENEATISENEGVEKEEEDQETETLKDLQAEIHYGKLILSYDIKMPTQYDRKIKFRLISSNGHVTTHPEPAKDTEVPLKSGKMILIQLVPEGDYSIEFFAENSEEEPFHKITSIHIDADKTKSIHESLSILSAPPQQPAENADYIELEDPITQNEKFNLSITANIPTAIFSLQNEEKSITWEGEGRLHTFEGLYPGKYLLTFESSDPFFVPPKPINIELPMEADNTIETIFQTLGKLKILSNISDAKAEIFDFNQRESLAIIEITEGMGITYLPEGEYRITLNAPNSIRNSPRPIDVKIHTLQTNEVNAYFK